MSALIEHSYGSDRFGLLCGYCFLGGAAGTPIDLDGARQWLRDPLPAGGDGSFVWLHFDLNNAAAESWIGEHLDVVPEFFEALREGSRSTRIEDAHNTLVAVVNDVAYEFAFDPSEIATLWANVGPRLAVTARVHPLRTIDRLRQAVRDGRRFESSVRFLNHLLTEHCGYNKQIAGAWGQCYDAIVGRTPKVKLGNFPHQFTAFDSSMAKRHSKSSTALIPATLCRHPISSFAVSASILASATACRICRACDERGTSSCNSN